MKRRIININEKLCNGCGICVNACHEGAISLVDGKARLVFEDHCDGLGDCLPACPVNAISFVEREAPAYDEEAVKRSRAAYGGLNRGCPSVRVESINREEAGGGYSRFVQSRLRQWPCQIKLVPVNAPYFDGADLLVAADCTAYAYGDFHNELMNKRITLIGCPKLDSVDYTEKLTAIITENDIKSVKVVRMEVPCCAGIENAVKRALLNSGKVIPWQVVTVSTDGKIINT